MLNHPQGVTLLTPHPALTLSLGQLATALPRPPQPMRALQPYVSRWLPQGECQSHTQGLRLRQGHQLPQHAAHRLRPCMQLPPLGSHGALQGEGSISSTHGAGTLPHAFIALNLHLHPPVSLRFVGRGRQPAGVCNGLRSRAVHPVLAVGT